MKNGAPGVEMEDEKVDNDGDTCSEPANEVDTASNITELSQPSSVGGRVCYTANDLLIFRQECSHIIRSGKAICTRELKDLFTTNPRLIPLYDKFGFNSLKIKMRTERNKVMKK